MPRRALQLAAAMSALLLGCAAGLDANCSCTEFCAGTCAATNRGTPHQLTMYRLTPGNVTGLADKDTGGSAGDLGFVFQRLSALARCSEGEANTNECFLAYQSIVKQFYVDVDGKFGPFMRCNPMQFEAFTGHSDLVDTKRWGCYPWHGRGPTPWNSTSGHGSDSCTDNTYCGAKMNASVGRDPAMHHAYDPKNPNIAEYFAGEWYSLHHDGECPQGRTPGDGKTPSCSWQLAPGKEGKAVNVTCLLGHVLPLVEKNGAACFAKCPQPLDWRNSCYLDCVPKAVMGTSSSPAIEPLVSARPVWRQLLCLPARLLMFLMLFAAQAHEIAVGAWNKAFTSTDPSEGGCADVTGTLQHAAV